MHEKTMNALVKSSEELGIKLETIKKYSGRGMFGRDTCAVVVPNLGDFAVCCAYAGMYYKNECGDFFLNDLKTLSTDSMGRDMVIY